MNNQRLLPNAQMDMMRKQTVSSKYTAFYVAVVLVLAVSGVFVALIFTGQFDSSSSSDAVLPSISSSSSTGLSSSSVISSSSQPTSSPSSSSVVTSASSSSSSSPSSSSSSSSTASSSSSSSPPVTVPTPVMSMLLMSDLADSITGTPGTYSLSSWAGGCTPSFPSVTLPNGATGTAYRNPCASANHYINTPFTYTNSFTIAAFVRRSIPSGTDVVSSASVVSTTSTYSTSSDLQPILYATSNTFFGKFNKNGNTLEQASATAADTVDTWYHQTISYNHQDKQFMIYQNGALLASSNRFIDTDWSTFTKPVMLLGGTPGVLNSSPLVGYMYKAKAFNYALSDEEVLAVYNSDRL